MISSFQLVKIAVSELSILVIYPKLNLFLMYWLLLFNGIKNFVCKVFSSQYLVLKSIFLPEFLPLSFLTGLRPIKWVSLYEKDVEIEKKKELFLVSNVWSLISAYSIRTYLNSSGRNHLLLREQKSENIRKNDKIRRLVAFPI